MTEWLEKYLREKIVKPSSAVQKEFKDAFDAVLVENEMPKKFQVSEEVIV